MANLFNRFGTELSVSPVRVRLTNEDMRDLAYEGINVRSEMAVWWPARKGVADQKFMALAQRWEEVTICPDCGELNRKGEDCLCEFEF